MVEKDFLVNADGKKSSARFARINLLPSGLWLMNAQRPRDYQLGSGFDVMAMTLTRDLARIYSADAAARIIGQCARLFPAAVAEPATFEEWVDQEAEPATSAANLVIRNQEILIKQTARGNQS